MLSVVRPKLEHDCTASPLLRYVSQRGGFEGWSVRPVVAITYDLAVRPDALRDACLMWHFQSLLITKQQCHCRLMPKPDWPWQLSVSCPATDHVSKYE